MEKQNIVIFDLLDTLQTYVGAETTGKAHYLQKTADSFGLSVEDMLNEKSAKEYLGRTAEP